VHDNTVTFGRNTTFYGTVYAPEMARYNSATRPISSAFLGELDRQRFQRQHHKPPGGSTAVVPTRWKRHQGHLR
jgi:hypothetical protein